ncbi:hypothetical protein DFJ77DRAFT_459356 [Powellomyces hirtus]|nr:hypothetical protein DFJ77DRAFT_459356 [Powellomyces hirtus]
MVFATTASLLKAVVVNPGGQSFMGEVVGTAMSKTIKVRVPKVKIHPVVQKPVTFHKTFFAHDAEERCVVGDYVRIDSCRRLSKHKNFVLGEIVKPAARYVDTKGVLHTQRAPGVGEIDKLQKLKERKGLDHM